MLGLHTTIVDVKTLRRPGAVALLVALLTTAGRGQGLGTWTRAASLPSSRTEVTGAEVGGRLYVIGGFGQGGNLVEAYHPRTDRWEQRAPVPVSLHHAAAVGVGAWWGPRWGLTDGRLVAFLFLVSIFVAPLSELSESFDMTQTAIAGWRKVLSVLAIPVDVADAEPGSAAA